MKPTFADLFSGIGGFRLGLERAGWECKWSCEIDEFCRKVYKINFKEEVTYRDIREIKEAPYVDMLCGGFPCQDLSVAGKRGGLQADRSGLWFEYLRVIRLVRPRYVFVENVPGLLSNGMDTVLANLAESGYDAEWDCIPASNFGLPHKRERVWLLAYPAGIGWSILHDKKGSIFAREKLQDIEQPGYRWQRENGGRSLENVGWSIKPAICGSDDGLSNQSHRLKSLGNAVVPQVVEWIGKRIIECSGCN